MQLYKKIPWGTSWCLCTTFLLEAPS